MLRILLLTSNPRQDLKLNREISDLISAIQRASDKFESSEIEFRVKLEVRSLELQESLIEHLEHLRPKHFPQIVHFCGHGAGEKGLLLQDEHGTEQLISNELLAKIFKNFADDINCTVLNACDTDHQAKLIVEHIDYVVGMTQQILDEAAIKFALSFYTGIVEGISIEKAYEIGCTQIQISSETNNRSSQSRQFRKFVYDPSEDEYITINDPLPEHLKPILLI